MDTTLYSIFLLVSFGLIIIPGPNVLVIVSTSLAHGRKQGLQTVAGTSSAMAIQLLLVMLGTAWFVEWLSNGLFYLKWIGVVYLLYLGINHLKTALSPVVRQTTVSASATFTRGFLVSLSNPKTLLFFSAFFPQFITTAGGYLLQIVILSGSFLLMVVVLDSCYALLAAKLRKLAANRHVSTVQNGFSGLLFLIASVWLAVTNRST